ncbi:MAG TPA: GAF domain-containing sensor histidine kinase [Rhodothermales bacterium]|nr:GAF domain-containing sensor histidine kinase [Rhodothermales bacterium]
MEDPTLPPDTPETARRLARLLDIGLALGAQRSLHELLSLLLETTTYLLECERASILLYDADRHRLRFAAATGERAEALARIPVPLNGSLAGAAFREDRPVLADAERDPRHFQSAAGATGFQPRVVLSVPMRFNGQPIGVLQALNPTAGRFGPDDAEVLMAVASQAAVAVRAATQRRDLQEANARLARLDQLKSDFVTVASHEMRTPLAALVGFAQVLREEADPSLAAHADEVLAAAGRLTQIVETLEELGSLGDPNAEDERARVVVQYLLRAAVEPSADGPALQFDLPPGRLVVTADAPRLQSAFRQVIGNALRFTPPGGRVTVRAEEDGDEAHVVVADTGRGIAAADLTTIFSAFQQVGDVSTREHEGLGVGLAIARAVVERHGGRIWAESPGPGKGSTFHVHLPLAPVEG